MSHVKGQWNVICDVCGFEFKSAVMRKRWDGLVVCKDDFELDHPQKYIKGRADPIPVPSDLIRFEPEDQFIGVCTAYTSQAIPGIGLPGCLIPSKDVGLPYSIYGAP